MIEELKKAMVEIKPILFNTEMVQAILDGRKTQTRRIVKEFTGETITEVFRPDGSLGKYGTKGWRGMLPDRGDWNTYYIEARPPCETGDILWVRETWNYIEESDDDGFYVYAADRKPPDKRSNWKWHPSIHMPKEAARIFLRVKDVRVEREDLREYGIHANPWVWVIEFERCEKPEGWCEGEW